MSPDETGALLQQHATIMSEIENVYIALAICAFIGLLFYITMILAAAWSVNKVNTRQRDLEGKFTVLIDVLLERAHKDIAARQVNVQSENVVVEEQQQHG